MNEVLETSPGVSWDAIAGLDEVKRLFWEIVVAPVRTRGDPRRMKKIYIHMY